MNELQRLLGKKTMKGEILKEALEIASGSKTPIAHALVAEGRFAMTAVCETLGITRSNIAERWRKRHSRARGQPPLANQELTDEIKTFINDMPTYGYRRVHAILSRKTRSENRP